MKKYIILLLSAISFSAMAQGTYDNVLSQIEANSSTLQALKQQMEAQKLENRTGIYLENPEAGFDYLWGSPSEEGNRVDFSISQSFDFPTSYAYRSQVAKGRNRVAEYEYEQSKKELLLEAGTACINLIYCNRLKAELDKRLQHSQHIFSAYQERFKKGDIDILERNKAQLNLLDAQKAVESNEIERRAFQADLERLNGGKPVNLDDIAYPLYRVSPDFDGWYEQIQQNNPYFRRLAQEIEISRRQEKLNRALSLPKMSAGYMSESVMNTTFQGLTFGVSIPLWENKNTIRQAKAQTAALQNMEADNRLQFYNSLKIQHARAISLQQMADNYREVLENTSNTDLLKKALDQGQLSLINYILELGIYYNAIDKMLQAERDSWLATIVLKQWDE